MTTRNRFFEAKGNQELDANKIIRSFSAYVSRNRYTITQEEVARRAHIMLTRIAELTDEQHLRLENNPVENDGGLDL